jgi:succinylglutamic semialdehyde dehydrogenase
LEGPRERLLRRGNYIWGSWVRPERVDGTIVGVNPGDRSDALGSFPFSLGAVDDAVDSGRRGFAAWRRVPTADRAKAVRKYRDVLSRQHERIAALVTRETGKPLWEARQEVIASTRAVDLLLEEGLGLLESRVLHEHEARSDVLPRGVVGMVVPFTLPLLVPTLQACAALLAGNAVVFKPSKYTPAVGQAVVELFDRCRLPRGVVNLVQGSGNAVGRRLAGHPGLDALLFGGSWSGARAVRDATAERPELATLLHCGGKAAAIVLGGDLDRAVYEILVGAYLTAGQRPNSTARVIVVDELFDAFAEALVRRTRRVTVGYGFDPGTFCGPVISEAHRTRYQRYGKALGQRAHHALVPLDARDVPGRAGFYTQPAVVEIAWSNGHPFLNDEPPGPVVLLYRVGSWEDAIELHNRLLFRSATSVFVEPDAPEVEEIVARVETGCLHVNRNTIGASLRLPSVPLGRASNGVGGGIDLLRFLSASRATLVESRPFDPTQAVPGIRWNDGPDADEDELPVLELDEVDTETEPARVDRGAR